MSQRIEPDVTGRRERVAACRDLGATVRLDERALAREARPSVTQAVSDAR